MGRTIFSIGIDPDLHHTGLALLCDGCDVGTELAVLDVKCIAAAGLKCEAAVIEMVHQLSIDWFPGSIGLGPVLITVEAQEIYLGGATKNPRNIMHLAQVAGAALACATRQFINPILYFPRPATWKGQVPKQIHQERTLDKLGWPCRRVGTLKGGYCYPTASSIVDIARAPLPKTHWKHVVDAMGLALWGLQNAHRSDDCNYNPIQ